MPWRKPGISSSRRKTAAAPAMKRPRHGPPPVRFHMRPVSGLASEGWCLPIHAFPCTWHSGGVWIVLLAYRCGGSSGMAAQTAHRIPVSTAGHADDHLKPEHLRACSPTRLGSPPYSARTQAGIGITAYELKDRHTSSMLAMQHTQAWGCLRPGTAVAMWQAHVRHGYFHLDYGSPQSSVGGGRHCH